MSDESRGAGPLLLRAPPFPWVPAERAAVSTRRIGASEADAARLDALVSLIRAARVGGTFWAPPVAGCAAGATVLRPCDAAEAEAFAARAQAPGGAIVAVLPEAPWAQAAAAMLAARGIVAAIGEVDPWSVLAPGARLIADPGDEWVAIAGLAGAEVVGMPPDTVRALLAAALFDRAAYRDCFSGEPVAVEQAVAILAEWRRVGDANRAIAAATGFAWWKRARIEQFLWAGRRGPLLFTDNAGDAVAAAQRASVAVWPSRAPAGLADAAAAAGVPIVRVEDGFIRSVGLGADLHPPFSVVVDDAGIYYDPTRPSALETILATVDFPPALLRRAEALTRLIVTRGISKYASTAPPAAVPTVPRLTRTVLVAGQVEDDMSVRLGAPGVAGNLDLLARARAAEPHATILFKPHPDVDAGHRKGRVPDAALLAHADMIVRDEPMAGLLGRVDAVHVLTSLTGFEALLRGLEVTTHGTPFYAGWGLTRDLAGRVARRTRRLTLAELVAGTLILYPRYLDPVTELPCPPEILLARFADGWRPRTTWLVRLRRWQGRLAKLVGTTSG